MSRKPYSLWKRKLDSGRTVYYVRFRLDDGSFGTAKSSGQTTKTAAEAWAIEYLASGQVITRENTKFSAFTKDFFAWDGPYIKGLQMRGRQIGKSHASNMQALVENYLNPQFGDEKLSRINAERIEEFTQELFACGLAASTINHALLTLGKILQAAYKKKLIQTIPLIESVSGKRAERGILTPEEVKAFFGRSWPDQRYYTINLIAATTGMRMGEIQALQRKAVHDDYLEVAVSWEKGHGIKGTKTNRARYVPMSQRVRQNISEIMSVSPFTKPDDFVFFGRNREAPLDHRQIEKTFCAALKDIGIDEETRRSRSICFHSWRHFFNSLLINARVPVLKVQTLTGHSTDRMTENYFHADAYEDVLQITEAI